GARGRAAARKRERARPVRVERLVAVYDGRAPERPAGRAGLEAAVRNGVVEMQVAPGREHRQPRLGAVVAAEETAETEQVGLGRLGVGRSRRSGASRSTRQKNTSPQEPQIRHRFSSPTE